MSLRIFIIADFDWFVPIHFYALRGWISGYGNDTIDITQFRLYGVNTMMTVDIRDYVFSGFHFSPQYILLLIYFVRFI